MTPILEDYPRMPLVRYSEQMSTELFTFDGNRKYVTAEEQERFIAMANSHERAEVRTLCLTLAYTGCRISEALELTTDRVDLSDKSITFRTLKQREKVKYRSVPCPDAVIDALELVHRVRKAQKLKRQADGTGLWPWGSTQATKLICSVMVTAGIDGDHASPKGLRHGFGVRMAKKTRNPRLLPNCWGIPSMRTPSSIWT